jgi:acyl-CoA dehydrogenase
VQVGLPVFFRFSFFASLVNMPSAVPFAEPPWITGVPSPYYDDSHRRLQQACQEFIGEHLTKHAMEWETAEEVPSHVWDSFAANNFIIPALPSPLPVEWLRKLGVTRMPGDIPVEEWTATHNMIYGDEVPSDDLILMTKESI